MTKKNWKAKWYAGNGGVATFHVLFVFLQRPRLLVTCYMFSLQSVTLMMNIHVNIITCCDKVYNAKCYMFSLQSVTIVNIQYSIFTNTILWQIVQCCKVFSLQPATLMHIHVKSHQLHVVKKMFNVEKWTCYMFSLHCVPPQQRTLYGWAW